MLLLHATFVDGSFWLWGETPELPEVSQSHRGRKARLQPHPNNPDPQQLLAAIPNIDPIHLQAGELLAWLPTAKNRPVPSSSLLGAGSEASAKVTLAPWKVVAVRLPHSVAVNLLCHCQGRETLQPGVLVGVTLAYWAQVARFAGALTT